MITPIRFFEWTSNNYSSLDLQGFEGKFLTGFQSYLDEVWQSRNSFNNDLKEESAKNQRFFSFDLNTISTRNYVGVVQYAGKRFEVYPKIFREHTPHDFKNYFQHFFYWLSYCRKLNFPVSKSALDTLENEDDFLEALIYIFANLTEQILTEQPFQAFEEVLEETPFLRGRLAMSEYIRQNITTGRWQYFQSEYEPLQYDNLFNRIVKYTSRILSEISTSARNKSKLQDIQFLLDEVSDCVCVASDCDKVKLNPLYSDLEDILQLCRLFLSNLTINNESPAESNFCFMLPMEYVFEDFIFSFIQEHFPEFRAKEQTGGYLANNGKKDVFKIKNDILLEKQKLIIDTKYKIRQDAKDGKAGVGQNDLYQMLAYAVKRGYHDVMLLYPEAPEAISEESKFTIKSPFIPDKPITITARNISIYKDNLEDMDLFIKEQIAKAGIVTI